MRQLALRFRGILQGRDPAKLDSWLDDAHRSGLYGLRRFAIPFGMTSPLFGMPLASVGATDKLRVTSIGSKLSNAKCMGAQERNCYALDSCLCSATSSPPIEEDPL
jgi:hypothetical protein